MSKTTTLPFGVDYGWHVSPSVNYGESYWGIDLADNRTVMLHADRLTIGPHGELLVFRDKRRGDADEWLPLETPECLLGLAPGTWSSFYAASVLDGVPVMIDSLSIPKVEADDPI